MLDLRSKKTRKMALETARERVKEGAAFLDTEHPGWDREINLTDLKLESTGFCVLGQLFGNYIVGACHFGLTENDAVNLAFNTNERQDDDHVYFKDLDVAWQELIGARREQHKAYKTYQSNIEYAKGYEDGYFDGQRSMLGITTVKEITSRLRQLNS